jgi:streptogramin lyase
MKTPRRLSALLFAAVLVHGSAFACRPFGSYEFIEDDAGGIWFTEGDNNAIARLAKDGTVKSYPLPTPHAEPISLARDRKGNIWFVESDGAQIGRLGRDGRIREYATTDGHPVHVALDRNGEAWFTQMSGNESGAGDHSGHGAHMIAKVGRIDGQGTVHSFPLAEGWPTSLVFDRDDRAWVTILVPGGKTDRPKGKLARLSRGGEWTYIAVRENSCPSNLLAAPDGRILFSDGCRNTVETIDARGNFREQALASGTQLQQMTFAADGTLWFTDRKNLGRIDAQGKVTIVPRPDNGDDTMAVLATRDGDIVFSEFYNYNVNRLTKNGELVEHLVDIEHRRGAREVRDGEICYVNFASRIAAKSEMDRKRAEEVKKGGFKPDGAGTERLVEQKCLVCHDARRLLLARRSDWTPSITRMHSYRRVRDVEPLTPEETSTLVRYFNEYYGLKP